MSLRKPPAAVEAFVQVGNESIKRPDVQTSRRRGKTTVQVRADGRELRRVTVYLPPEVHTRLRVRCAEEDRDLSDAVTAAVAAYLS